MVEKQASPASYADFENEKPAGWLRTVVQFFAIPLLIVCVAVGIYVGIRVLVGGGPESAADFVQLLRSDTINRRWQAAYELADRLRDGEVPDEFRDPRLVQALCQALDEARDQKDDPPRMAQVLLGLLARLKDPASIDTVRAALGDEHDWVRSQALVVLAALDDRESRPRMTALASHDDHGTRQAALEALAMLDQVEGLAYRIAQPTREIALRHLDDPHEDVRFTAALILADSRDRAALPVLKKMLDRGYLEGFAFDTSVSGINRYRVHSNLIRKAIERTVHFPDDPDPEIISALRRLKDPDQEGDGTVRQAADAALRLLRKNPKN